QRGAAPRPAGSVRCKALAGFVPALSEVVVYVGDCGAREVDIHVVVLAFAGMAGARQRMGIEVEAADEGALSVLAGVDHPALLMLAIAGRCAVPAHAEIGMVRAQLLQVLARAPERIASQVGGFVVGSPEEQTHVQSAPRRPLQDGQGGA